jgi:hypothetical protein
MALDLLQDGLIDRGQKVPPRSSSIRENPELGLPLPGPVSPHSTAPGGVMARASAARFSTADPLGAKTTQAQH